MEVIVTIVSKLGYFTCLRDLQPTFIGVIIHLLSTMDTLVVCFPDISCVFLNQNLVHDFGFKMGKISAKSDPKSQLNKVAIHIEGKLFNQ